MCGKPNPEDLEVCQFCQARLSPLIAPGSEEKDTTPAPGSESDELGPAPEIESTDWLQDIRHDEDVSDWNQDESSAELSATEPESEAGSSEFAVELPDWIAEETLEMEQDFEPGPSSLQPEDVSRPEPEQGESALDASSSEPQAPKSAETGLEPASVPDWLESMRPILQGETGSASSQPAEPVESTGPLAGLRGVLAADALISRPHGPATRPTKLRVSANQLVHIDLLKELVENEGKSQPLPQKRAISSEHVLRWVIALVLCLAVLWSILYPGQPAELPAYQEEAAELNRLIEQLPEEGRVLLAFDYQPGLFAELDATAYEVVNHLMEQSAYLTLVSSSPMGPILAQRFVEGMQSNYPYGVQYANLGYIPGGTAGLASMIGNLPRTLPYTIEGEAAWGNAFQPNLPPLEGIDNIRDYALILVLVDDPDVARSWVEQLTPLLSDPLAQGSLGMVASAQLEPVVRPYFDANPRQVHGFVAGLRGGASYARLNGRDSTADSFWESFGMGLFIAVLLILVGGLIFSIYPMLTRPAKPKSEAEG
jgi:hypothetical protein